MDDSSRDFIIENITQLVKSTDYKTLLSACEKEELLSYDMCAQIENLSDATEEDKHMELFKKITKRGPQAFDKLIEILIKFHFPDAAILLHKRKSAQSTYISINDKENKNGPQNHGSTCVQDGSHPSKNTSVRKYDSQLPLDPIAEDSILDRSFIVKKSTVIQQSTKMPVYPMRSKNRGVLLMVNIINFPKTAMKKREGAETDGKNLLYLFKELGFTCFEYVDISSQQFFDVVDRLCRSEYARVTESFVLILMSHGEITDVMNDRVEFHDASIVKLDDIQKRFTNKLCNSLKGKPKVLMFPFCRGASADIGVSRLQKDGYCENHHNIPTISDVLVCFGSVPGFATIRDTKEGSWYVQALYEVFAEHAHDTHLEDMLKLICTRIMALRSSLDEMQTPAFINNGFMKHLFFNPGVLEN